MLSLKKIYSAKVLLALAEDLSLAKQQLPSRLGKVGKRANGRYVRVGTHNGMPKYRQDNGEANCCERGLLVFFSCLEVVNDLINLFSL